MPPNVRSDLDIHLKKDHNPAAVAAADGKGDNAEGIGSSEPEEEDEGSRPFTGVKVRVARWL